MLKTLVCILKEKPRNVKIGYLQNIKQLKEAYHMNKKKWSAEKDDYDYLYRIVLTGSINLKKFCHGYYTCY